MKKAHIVYMNCWQEAQQVAAHMQNVLPNACVLGKGDVTTSPGQAYPRQATGGQASIALVRSPSDALMAVAPSSHGKSTLHKHITYSDQTLFIHACLI